VSRPTCVCQRQRSQLDAAIGQRETIALIAIASPLNAAQLTDHNQRFLTAYEKVHHALVADDLAGARQAASDLGPRGTDLAQSKSLKEARNEFAN
jgi:cobalamin biosynthesis protein CobD/CbiB